MTIRTATLADAEAITAIYAPIVENTSISFELSPPSVDEMRGRIVKTLPDLPWLVSEDSQGSVNGYVYASKHREVLAVAAHRHIVATILRTQAHKRATLKRY